MDPTHAPPTHIVYTCSGSKILRHRKEKLLPPPLLTQPLSIYLCPLLTLHDVTTPGKEAITGTIAKMAQQPSSFLKTYS